MSNRRRRKAPKNKTNAGRSTRLRVQQNKKIQTARVNLGMSNQPIIASRAILLTAFYVVPFAAAVAALYLLPGVVNLELALVLLVTAAIVFLLRSRLGWLPRPKVVSVTLVIIAILMGALGYKAIRKDDENSYRAAMTSTCQAANNFREAYTTGLDGLVASSWNAKAQGMLLQQLEGNLASLSDAADDTDSEAPQSLVHQIRSFMMTAFSSQTPAEIYSFESRAWNSFQKLSELCDRAGVSVSTASHPAVIPSAKVACEAFAQIVLYNKGDGRKRQQIIRAFGRFEFNALNVQNQEFANDAAEFLYAMEGKASPKEAIESLRSDCLSLGIPVKSVVP